MTWELNTQSRYPLRLGRPRGRYPLLLVGGTVYDILDGSSAALQPSRGRPLQRPAPGSVSLLLSLADFAHRPLAAGHCPRRRRERPAACGPPRAAPGSRRRAPRAARQRRPALFTRRGHRQRSHHESADRRPLAGAARGRRRPGSALRPARSGRRSRARRRVAKPGRRPGHVSPVERRRRRGSAARRHGRCLGRGRRAVHPGRFTPRRAVFLPRQRARLWADRRPHLRHQRGRHRP